MRRSLACPPIPDGEPEITYVCVPTDQLDLDRLLDVLASLVPDLTMEELASVP